MRIAPQGDSDFNQAMKRNPQVITFMTPFPHSVDISAPLADARQMMREHNFRHLPVMSAGALVGVLTDRDILLILGPDGGRPPEQNLTVRDAHVEQPCVVAASTPVAEVARLMADERIGCTLVTKHNKLVGIFTVTDACRALAEILGESGDIDDIVA